MQNLIPYFNYLYRQNEFVPYLAVIALVVNKKMLCKYYKIRALVIGIVTVPSPNQWLGPQAAKRSLRVHIPGRVGVRKGIYLLPLPFHTVRAAHVLREYLSTKLTVNDIVDDILLQLTNVDIFDFRPVINTINHRYCN